MNQLTVIRYTKAHAHAWNDFVQRSCNATFLFHRDFMDYHSDRFVDHSMMIYQDEKLVALFPANSLENTLVSHGGLSYGGLLVTSKSNFQTLVTCYRSLLATLFDLGVETLQLKTIPSIYHEAPSEAEELVLHWLQAEATRFDIYSYIDLRTGYKPNRNRNRAIKVAEESGLKVKESEDLKTFWQQILIPNLKERFGVNPVHTLEEIQLLKERFPEQIKLFAAFDGLAMKAGALMFKFDHVAHFQYSSGVEDRSENAALDLLFHRVIETFSDKAYVSFGSSAEKQGTVINKGLLYWKESYGGRNIAQRFYTIQTKNHTLLQNRFS